MPFGEQKMKIRNVLTFVFLLLLGLLQACSEDNDKMTETWFLLNPCRAHRICSLCSIRDARTARKNCRWLTRYSVHTTTDFNSVL